ncbi:hypothetical protein CHS0354_000216 [Potamilus streckersoni]|uniref:Uncharacterized protein n=1 Tax=Potamilus streckersoni TaxID=2493646 RepID=A0AAE0SHP3_9BIVA|nr:hypothetical protein CHS0354_000216 [Potamilus streckersoni]
MVLLQKESMLMDERQEIRKVIAVSKRKVIPDHVTVVTALEVRRTLEVSTGVDGNQNRTHKPNDYSHGTKYLNNYVEGRKEVSTIEDVSENIHLEREAALDALNVKSFIVTAAMEALNIKSFNVTAAMDALNVKSFNVTAAMDALNVKSFNVTAALEALNVKSFNVTAAMDALNVKSFNVTAALEALNVKSFNIKGALEALNVKSLNVKACRTKLIPVKPYETITVNGIDRNADSNNICSRLVKAHPVSSTSKVPIRICNMTAKTLYFIPIANISQILVASVVDNRVCRIS